MYLDLEDDERIKNSQFARKVPDTALEGTSIIGGVFWVAKKCP
jgi:hypothetical protein